MMPSLAHRSELEARCAALEAENAELRARLGAEGRLCEATRPAQAQSDGPDMARRLARMQDDYRALFDAIDDGICIIEFVDGPEGPHSDYKHAVGNAAFARQSGLTDAIGRTARQLFPNEAGEWIAIYRRVLDTGEAIRFERVFETTGRLFELSAYRIEPRSQARVVVLLRDITDRKRIERELQSMTAHLDALVRSSSEVRYVVSADWSELRQLSGGGFIVDALEANRNWIADYIPLDQQDAVRAEIRRAIETGDAYCLEHGVRRVDGTTGWVLSRAVPVLNAAGAATAWIGSASDITARRQAEDSLQVANQELAHRMKNMLALVQAIAVQTLRGTQDVAAAREAISSRLVALGRAQDALMRTNWERTDIRAVVADAMEPHWAGAGRVTMEGPAHELDAQQALGLSLALHELATNAAKYGALSNMAGSVAISWASADAFSFRWAERGGPPVAKPTRRGLGSRLVETIVAGYFDGEGEIDFAPDGVTFHLRAPRGRERS